MYSPIWIPLANLVDAARKFVEHERGEHADNIRRALAELDSIVATSDEREAAFDMYKSDDIEIDSCALISRCDTGYWVSASVFVPYTQSEEE